MEAKKTISMGHVQAWLAANAVAVAVAVLLLLLLAVFVRLASQPVELSSAVFAASLASISAFAIAALGIFVAVNRADAATATAAREANAVHSRAESELADTRERAEHAIASAQDAVRHNTDTAAFFERLRFTQMLLDGRDVRETAEWLDNIFLTNGGDIRRIRDDLKRDLVCGSLDATRKALGIHNVLAAVAEYYYSNLVVPDIILSRMAVRTQLAGFYFGPAFTALGMINRTGSRHVQRFLDDTRAYTRKNEPWLEQFVPEFYQEAELQKGADFPVTRGEIPANKVTQIK